jgi:DNA polymerase III delta prime subunit
METFISKYKPYYLNDFCMNESTRTVIQTLFDIDDLNILFVGAPGSGKTTLLYSIIREYYGLSKTANIPETNILFINNLKEQGINYYRNDMKTFCQSQSTIPGKKKMIVIDDLDNINEQSQQVFRNYIDKYKHNIHFISVCTNIQKIIESIQSRIHTIKLHSPKDEEIVDIMNMIIEQENIKMTEDAKDYLIKQINGSIRVLIHYLEKFFIYDKLVDYDVCREMCSTISIHKFEEFFELLKQKRLGDAIQVLYSLYDQGYSVIDILDYFFIFIKATDILTENQKYQVIPFLCKYITIFNNIHEDVVELAFFTNNIYSIIYPSLDFREHIL